jgi:phage-related protein
LTHFRKEAAQAGETIGKGLSPVFQVFGALFQTVTGSIRKAWDAAWPSINKAMQELFANLPKILPYLQLMGGLLAGLAATIGAVLVGLASGFIKALPAIIGFFSAVMSAFGDAAKFIIDLVKAIFGKGGWGAVGDDLKHIVGDVLSILGNFKDLVWGFLSGFVEGFVGFFESLWDKLTRHSVVPEMVADIVKVFQSLPELLLSIGENLVQGLIHGIQNKLGDLKNAIGNAAGDAVQHFKDIFGIHSPSSVFMTLGQQTMKGYIVGLQSMHPQVQAAMPQSVDVTVNQTGNGGWGPSWADQAKGYRQDRYNLQDGRHLVTRGDLMGSIGLQYRRAYQATA